MANNDLAIKFSNEVYATKKEVAEYMKMPMVDNFWNSILEYRNNFGVETGLKHITGVNYSLHLTPGILSRSNEVERKLMKLYGQYLKLVIAKSSDSYQRICYKEILKSFAKNYNLVVDDIAISKILNKNVSSLDPGLLILYHYYLVLLDIRDNYSKEFDSNTLKNFLSIILGSEITTYRTNEIENRLSKAVINKLYLGIPTEIISKNVDQLVTFINSNNVSMFIKAICALYFIYYVKPMDAYSEEIGILSFKDILAINGLDEVGSCLNFEVLLEDKDTLEKYILESQKTMDLTYLVDYVLKISDAVIDEAYKNLNLAKASEIRAEAFEEDGVVREDMPNLNVLKNQIVDNSSINKEDKINFSQNIAISNVPTGLSELEARKLEQHLLELNPNLSHGQAYFYARHCTLGMSYTISQYKKEVGCAYETARRSMDNLVFLGYYKKELVKNKFIYLAMKKN